MRDTIQAANGYTVLHNHNTHLQGHIGQSALLYFDDATRYPWSNILYHTLVCQKENGNDYTTCISLYGNEGIWFTKMSNSNMNNNINGIDRGCVKLLHHSLGAQFLCDVNMEKAFYRLGYAVYPPHISGSSPNGNVLTHAW